jgi:protein SCO1/2
MNLFKTVSVAVALVGALFTATAQAEHTSADAGHTTMASSLPALPGTSVYQLKTPLVDQEGKAFIFDNKRGHPTIVSMFYTSCQFVCPMLIDTMGMVDAALSAEERAKLSLMLVSFDPARDSVAALKAVSRQHSLDSSRWSLARTDAANVRKLAATLGILYRHLANGEFNHSTTLVLLDADGRIVARTNKIGALDPAFVAQVHKTLLAATQ